MTLSEYNSGISEELKAKVANKIAHTFGLTFISDENPSMSSVCFADKNDELRDDFKQVFTAIDILDYMFAVGQSSKGSYDFNEGLTQDFSKIPFPENPIAFWQLVQLGSQIRQKVK